MNRNFIITADGSHTIQVPGLQVTYHSVHGAIQESMHVYIKEGLLHIIERLNLSTINIFEMGFGTGLNAFLSAIEAERRSITVNYTSIDDTPLTAAEYSQLNYANLLGHKQLFHAIHNAEWNAVIPINKHFKLLKLQSSVESYETSNQFHLIYYDAFDPAVQPHLWTQDIFDKMYKMLLPGSALVTYSTKGKARRAMKAAGFEVNKLPGPPGKREITRASHVLNAPANISILFIL